ncbi:hypothetical protein TanjilG_23263 [Lupinus angustifolius]|uniref:Uncharacterized protein n=1 Tax=Lupinus angustifolius TaxID=3871 RepID=A0A1J7HUK6_LUPAN|nr:hypothetical protein TanjilG_23263 [Lupinus angustifolius]
MTHASNFTISSLRNLSSPIPYLFGGLALLLGLISIALFIIVCSYRKHYSSSTINGDEEKPTNKVVEMKVDSKPKIVVIMAGENNPTYLANPVPPITYSEHAFGN